MRWVLLVVVLVGCRGSGDVARAFCDKESACTGAPIEECMEGRKEMAADDARCGAKNDAMLRCMTAQAKCQHVGTMKFLHPGDACKREVDALAACRSGH